MTTAKNGEQRQCKDNATNIPNPAEPIEEPAGTVMQNPLAIPGEVERRRNTQKAKLSAWLKERRDATSHSSNNAGESKPSEP